MDVELLSVYIGELCRKGWLERALEVVEQEERQGLGQGTGQGLGQGLGQGTGLGTGLGLGQGIERGRYHPLI